MARRDERIEHLLRRAGFSGSPDEVAGFAQLGFHGAVDYLVFYEQAPNSDLDARIGVPGHVGVTTRDRFSPDTAVRDARQRWLFRMVHSRRPLQEKMALFWHHHFATAYQKVADTYGGTIATRMMAASDVYNEPKASPVGQIEFFRRNALGNFYDLLVGVARDPAMLVWLDGRLNVRSAPQENFAREVMELFTMGIRPSDTAPNNYTEDDVKAAARVFTGWNLRVDPRGTDAVNDPTLSYGFLFRPERHDTQSKTFSFDIYPGGGRTIAASGEQEGLDFLLACCRHPQTGPRLARKLYAFFVSELTPAPQAFVDRVAATFYSTNFDMRRVIHQVLLSAEFQDESCYYTRYAWPVEFVVKAIKETGWNGFSVDSTITPLVAMGQTLFEPPDVNGWETGPGWFSTGGMLARMNFAASLTQNQRFNLREAARASKASPESVLSHTLHRLSPMPFEPPPYNELLGYLRAGTNWTGSDAELLAKSAGVTHLVLASPQYQFV
ncbi:MAG: DUF1800 domain-containing protein [Acidobacteria bacterium]|nr:DUF1800 domain-containing protein [Acidobacteriota bacterium]